MDKRKVPGKILPDISVSLVLVFLGMFAITGAFEVARYVFLPHEWIGEIPFLTVIIASAGAGHHCIFSPQIAQGGRSPAGYPS